MPKVKIEIQPTAFSVPNSVEFYDERSNAHQIPLSMISSKDLEHMCEEFTKRVFKEAGKSRPIQEHESPVEIREVIKRCSNCPKNIVSKESDL